MPHTAQLSNSTIASSELLNADNWSSSLDHAPPPNLNQRDIYPSAPPSPALSGFNFHEEDSDSPVFNHAPEDKPLPKRKVMDVRPKSSSGESHSVPKKAPQDVSKRRTRQFEDQFAYKDNWETNTADEVRRDSPVLLELRTNVIVHDEYALVTELSKQAAKRYQRDEVNIMVSVFHSTCLMFGGSFEPAYFLTVTAIEQHCQTATNKRNAALMQSFLSDILKVPLHRGLVRFNPIPEDCLATGGRTVAAEVEEADAEHGVKKTPTTHKRKSMRFQSISAASGKPEEKPLKDKRKSLMSLGRRREANDKINEEVPQLPEERRPSRTAAGQASRHKNEDALSKLERAETGPSDLPSASVAADTKSQQVPNTSQANTSKRIESQQSSPHPSTASFSKGGNKGQPLPNSPKAFLNHSRPTSSHRSSNVEESTKQDVSSPQTLLVPPPIPDDIKTLKVNRRKSLMTLFRRDPAKAS